MARLIRIDWPDFGTPDLPPPLGLAEMQARLAAFRAADISKARRLLGYVPSHRIEEGVRVAMPWYVSRFGVAAGVH